MTSLIWASIICKAVSRSTTCMGPCQLGHRQTAGWLEEITAAGGGIWARNRRQAGENRQSFVPQRYYGIDLRRTPRGQISGEQTRQGDEQAR